MITNVEAVAKFLEHRVQHFTDVAVVGISGGVDSSVVASLCVAALGKDKVHLVSMPFDNTDVKTFNQRSAELADQLGAHHYVVAIGPGALAMEQAIEGVFGSSLHTLTRANIRPRVRMNVLYSISGELGYEKPYRVRVMGTGHLSEDLIGYDTKGGDALCDIFVLSDLVKSEVYQLAKHYRVPSSIVEAIPSAGLYAGQTDEQELGHTYTALEPATLRLHALLGRGVPREDVDPNDTCFEALDPELVRFVVERYKAHHHKHEAPVTVEVRRAEWFDG